jgi:glycosyltransferase involved in cell wall biosynthesis
VDRADVSGVARALGWFRMTKVHRTRLLIVVNAEWYFWSHRLGIAKGLLAQGFDVAVAAADEQGYSKRIRAEGIRFIPLRLDRRSRGGWQDFLTLRDLYCLYRRERPDLVHHVTIKPVIYGSIAARFASVPAVVNAIPGLGYMFIGTGLSGRIRRGLAMLAYRAAMSSARVRVIFQNPDDQESFQRAHIVRHGQSVVIRGSGVDLRRFHWTAPPAGRPIIVLPSRLLWDKGVGELVRASRILKQRNVDCRVALVGVPDPYNPQSVTADELKGWASEQIVEWWGHTEDMPGVMARASIVVLPSYREGVPKALLEAAAAGRPMIASDVPGCREIVRHGETGLLVPVRDATALADAIGTLVNDPAARARMGLQARALAEAHFSLESVVEQTFAVYRAALGPKWMDVTSAPA